MSSELDIWNLALAHLGEGVEISDIDEQSPEAGYCRRFYPMARDTIQSLHPWSFCSTSALLGTLNVENHQWQQVYTKPANTLGVFKVTHYQAPRNAAGVDFELAALPDGREVILTDQEEALALYSFRVVKAQKFSPLYVESCSAFLASRLSGPIIRGDKGRKIGKDLEQVAFSYFNMGAAIDTRQSQVEPEHKVGWIEAR